MNRLTRWLDGVVERLCNGLNDTLSSKRRLALLGNGLAGVYGGTPLPVDRRIGAEILEMHTNQWDNANAAHAKGGGHFLGGNCGFWAYCHLSGDLCVWCDGENALMPGNPYAGNFSKAGKDLCPNSSYAGQAWYGCCKDPSGKGKLIAFLDCCDPNWMHNCGPFRKSCKNWPEAKNWCWVQDPATLPEYRPQYYTERYYCTVVIDMNSDAACN